MRRTLALLGAIALLAGACGDDDDSTAQSGSLDPKAAASEFTVTGAEYSYQAPAEVSGGVVTMKFENKGKLVHEAAVLGIGDTTPNRPSRTSGPSSRAGRSPPT